MQSTREQVLELLLQRHSARVEDLAGTLGLSPAGVRRHLDYLRTQGLVDVRMVRQHSGRPYYEFFPTRKALDKDGGGYSRLVERLFHQVSRLGKEEISGRNGEEILGEALEKVAEDVALEHRGDIRDSQLDGRIREVTEALREEGILEGWAEEQDGYRLYNSSCPYIRAAELSRAPCESDRRVIELLLGEEVVQVGTVVDGHHSCEYLVKPGCREPQQADIENVAGRASAVNN